jgi:hypothetical protein
MGVSGGFVTSAETVRCDWGVPLSWARAYPAWPQAVREWVANVRRDGLTVITVRPGPHGVDLIATRPGEPVGDYA